MRALADENVPAQLVAELRARGDDVASCAEVMRGASDEGVIERARREGRVLLTLDEDMAARAARLRRRRGFGVILFRRRAATPVSFASSVAAVLADGAGWEGAYSVLDGTVMRRRRLR